MWTIFFDIDGTLIRTGGAGLVSMLSVMKTNYGVDKLPQVPVHGRTDCGIWKDVFEHLQLPLPNELDPLIGDYCDVLKTTLNRERGTLLPGVVPLLQRLGQQNLEFSICLLTGNAELAARIKLDAFGLTDHFTIGCDKRLIGGFGDSTPCRNEVAGRAVKSATQNLTEFRRDRMWVIGDTVRDIECARSIGARVMAVETGGDSLENLLVHKPDEAVQDLSKTDEIVERLLAGQSSAG